MTSDGQPWRPLVHVLDICDAIGCVLEAPREKVHNQIFNVGATSDNYRVKEIAEILLKDVFKRLTEQNITLSVTDKFKERLIEEGYNPAYGARPLRRAIMRLLGDVLAEEILSGRVSDGDTAMVDIDEEGKVKVISGERRELIAPVIE